MSEHFQVPTADGRAVLRGQIDFPMRQRAGSPAALIVPGGWFMDRDGFMGGGADARCLLYRELAAACTCAGLAAVRFDNRGVRCSELTMPPCHSEDEQEVARHYLASCVDFAARRHVTPETNEADVESVYAWLRARLDLAESGVVLVCHSEGALHAARLLGRRRIDPAGVVFLGAIAESPAACLRWQVVDRCVERVLAWDGGGEGTVTPDAVRRGYAADPFFAAQGIALEELLPEGAWSEAALRVLFTERYEQMRREALERDPSEPYPPPDPDWPLVNASHAWWRQWFEDETPLIARLAEYRGEIRYHLGEIDSQARGERQIAAAREHPAGRRASICLHPGRGHAFRTGEAMLGPADPEAVARIAADVASIPGR